MIFEPLDYYKNELKDKFDKRLNEIFDENVKNSNVDIDKNHKLIKEINKLDEESSRLNRWRKFYKFLSIISIIGLVILGLWAFNDIEYVYRLRKILKWSEDKSYIIGAIESGVSFLADFCFLFIFLRKKKKNLQEKLKKVDDLIADKKNQGYDDLAPLYNLFTTSLANKIIEKIVPQLTIDKNFNMERYVKLVNNYDLTAQFDNTMSTTDVISGEVQGNPFIILKCLSNYVQNKVYTGAITVSWTEYYTDSEGKRQSRTVSETLTASIVRPAQIFQDEVFLCFGSDVAPNLNFSRNGQNVHTLSDKKLQKHIKKEIKNLRKFNEKSIREGSTFTQMQNEEFEVLFNALNRDNEVEFRLLFTALAQQNMLKLLKDKDFGDNFTFNKLNKLNIIQNSNIFDLNIDKEYYADYDFENMKKRYLEINRDFLKSFYKLFLPILSIPAYMDHKTREFIYDDSYTSNFNPYMSEIMANRLGEDNFKNKNATTRAILKTINTKKDDKLDEVQVKAYSYTGVERVEYVRKSASNGNVYDVPVYWIEYIPVSNTSYMNMQKTSEDDSYKYDIKAEIKEELC